MNETQGEMRMDQREAGRTLALLREKRELVCDWCGVTFVSYPGTRFHTQACRVAAYYAEHKARLNAERSARRRMLKSEEGKEAT